MFRRVFFTLKHLIVLYKFLLVINFKTIKSCFIGWLRVLYESTSKWPQLRKVNYKLAKRLNGILTVLFVLYVVDLLGGRHKAWMWSRSQVNEGISKVFQLEVYQAFYRALLLGSTARHSGLLIFSHRVALFCSEHFKSSTAPFWLLWAKLTCFLYAFVCIKYSKSTPRLTCWTFDCSYHAV